MVLRVDYMNSATAVNRQRPWIVQLTGLASRSAPAAQRSTLHGELLHAVVVPLGDIQDSLWPKRKVVGIGKLPRLGAVFAPTGHKISVAGEDLDAMIAGIGDVEEAIRSKR